MALTKCKECDHQVSTSAKSCPQCGVTLNRATKGCGTLLFLAIAIPVALLVLLYQLGDISRTMTGSPTVEEVIAEKYRQHEYAMGQTFDVGSFRYTIHGTSWADHLVGSTKGPQPPSAAYLHVDFTIANIDDEPIGIPPFNLEDDATGAEYQQSEKAWRIPGAVGPFESLNPGVERRTVVVFDVPEDRAYRLRLSGGVWSGMRAFVPLAEASVEGSK